MTVPFSPRVSTSWSKIACGMVPGLTVAVAIAVAVPVPVTSSTDTAAGRVGHVRQQGELAGPLDRPGDLALVAPARAGDSAGADLAALRDEPAQHRQVLVVDLVD